MFRYNPVNEAWQRETCTRMGLTYCRTNQFGASGPDQILTRPHRSRNVVGDGNCLFRAFAKIITGSVQDHYAVRISILSYMITIGHHQLGHHLARDDPVSKNTLRELAWTGMAPGVLRWRCAHWHTCCTSTFTRIKSAVPIVKYGPDVLHRNLSADIRDVAMYIKHRYNHFMVVSNASRPPEPSE